MGDGGKEKSRKKTSSVWKYCEIIDEAFARCTICDHKLSYKSSVTNLRKHFKKKHPEVAMPANVHHARNGVITLNSDEEEEREDAQRATNSVIVDYLRPAGEENRPKTKPTLTFVRQTPVIKRDRSPIRYHDYSTLETKCKKSEVTDETEFDVFGRNVVLQLKQLPLVHALELQAEIMNLIVQKRIQALRQTHETNTDETPMQYALVYTTETPVASEPIRSCNTPEAVKEAEANQSYVKL
ncbi:uncharacterized protein [Parasteatoda tepidariorum]|nr:uncharacterized protein LOC107439673 isoform X2 [Parasteatoda tepidariorum]